MWQMAVERLAGSWDRLSLRKKMYILVAALGLIVGASIFMNLRVLYYFTDTFNAVMSDNLSCHRFQEALSVEAEASCWGRVSIRQLSPFSTSAFRPCIPWGMSSGGRYR